MDHTRNGPSLLLYGWLALVSAVGLSSCGGALAAVQVSAQNGGGTPSTLTVFAAASLTDAFHEIAQRFKQQHPSVEVRFSFGGSSTLLAQLVQGAPADIFASADQAKMDTAVQKQLVQTPSTFARNKLVVVVPKANPANLQRFADLAKTHFRLVLAQDGVPIAEYTKQVLQKANKSNGSGFSAMVLANLVSREADVRASVNRIVLGDADATFAYVSDVTPAIRNRVTTIPIPDEFNVQASYPIAIMKTSSNATVAQQWIDFVESPAGQHILRTWGFQ